MKQNGYEAIAYPETYTDEGQSSFNSYFNEKK